MPRSTARAVPDLDDLFTPGWLLRDTNADGLPDDLRARIVLAEEPDAELWCALLDLAARLGLETSGISFPLVVTAPQPDTLPIVVRNGRSSRPVVDPTGWAGSMAVIAEGDAAVRCLALAGQADRRAQSVPLAPWAGQALDLADLFDTSGLLVAERDTLPVGSRLCVVVPPNLPRPVGIGLIHLAARLGMESGGIDLPLATTGACRPGTIPLRVHPKQGYLARLSVVPTDETQEPALELVGDPRQAGLLFDRLARSWPRPPAGDCPMETREITAWLRRSLAGWTAEGRHAALAADLELHREALAGEGASIQLWTADPTELERHARIVRAVSGAGLPVLGGVPGPRAFAHEWSARWEVERALDLLRERLLPRLIRGLPFRLTIVVSEPLAVRQRLREDALRLFVEAGFRGQDCDIVVLDAFKAGLSWLREAVLPAWSGIDRIDRVVIGYRPFEPNDRALDLRIRWLQELFPGDEIVAEALGLPLDRVTLVEWDGEACYRAEAFAADGSRLAQADFSPLTYQRPYISLYPDVGTVQVVTGGLIAEQVGRTFRERVPTDLDLFWDYFQTEILARLHDHILAATDGAPRRADQPFFAELRVDISVSETDEPFGIRDERNSAAEALHEDIYFNALDLVEALGEHSTGERLNAPGAIVPFVHVRPGLPPHARITLTARARSVATLAHDGELTPLGAPRDRLPAGATVESLSILDDRAQLQIRLAELDDAGRRRLKALGQACRSDDGYPPLVVIAPDGSQTALGWPERPARPAAAPAQAPVAEDQLVTEEVLAAQLSRLADRAGVRVEPALDWSWEGRPIPAIEVTAPISAETWSRRKLSLFKPTLLVVARHHANEVASTTAALRLVEYLTSVPEWRRLGRRVNLAILPFENPDGAALHDRLRQEHPTWKHHPARYNAVGFEFGEDNANPVTPYGEARVRERLWHRWLPDIVADNHGVPSHEWAQVFAGFGSPPRFGVSYWLVQALIYGIIPYLDSPDFPEHRAAAFALREAVARAAASDAEILELNRRYRERYVTWGTSRVPERFPADIYRDMIFYFGPHPEERLRARRGYALRFPHTTVASWVSEVGDETAQGAQLRRTARAHLLANRATIELLAAAATPPERRILSGPASSRITLARRRPIRLGP